MGLNALCKKNHPELFQWHSTAPPNFDTYGTAGCPGPHTATAGPDGGYSGLFSPVSL